MNIVTRNWYIIIDWSGHQVPSQITFIEVRYYAGAYQHTEHTPYTHTHTHDVRARARMRTYLKSYTSDGISSVFSERCSQRKQLIAISRFMCHTTSLPRLVYQPESWTQTDDRTKARSPTRSLALTPLVRGCRCCNQHVGPSRRRVAVVGTGAILRIAGSWTWEWGKREGERKDGENWFWVWTWLIKLINLCFIVWIFYDCLYTWFIIKLN